MSITLFPADERGRADHGWLKSFHSFSFADYYNPQRMGFGLLRVVNDDRVDPSMGFGTHPHRNMEIISVPLSGALRHQDSMGNQHVIEAGEIQVMSAGTGVTHSEFNHSDKNEVNFLQIWVMPNEYNIEPKYGQKRFDESGRKNQWQLVVSPTEAEGSIWINQNAYFSMADLDSGIEISYQKHSPDNGVYAFIIEGQVTAENHTLQRRDAMGIENQDGFTVTAKLDSKLLVIEVPMG